MQPASRESNGMGKHRIFVCMQHLVCKCIIDEEIGKVNLPTINKAIIKIHAVINPITSKKKEFRHLLNDSSMKALQNPYDGHGIRKAVRNRNGTIY